MFPGRGKRFAFVRYVRLNNLCVFLKVVDASTGTGPIVISSFVDWRED